MKVVGTGNTYRIYDDNLKTYDQLPADVFSVRFSQMSGFFLEKHGDIEIKEEKIYGVHDAKLKKVFDTFDTFERNMGIILSGDKGMGKSLFAKMLTITAVERGQAVILVSDYIPGIADFLNEIEQEAIIVFDEFDKTFGKEGKQNELLTILDGFGTGKKMFAITCNNVHILSDYYVNRTGRFHYHFRFEYPSPEEIRTYLKDKLDTYDEAEVGKIVSFSTKVKLNYDSLRAIVFEINHGETFASAIQDLNILNINPETYIVEVLFTDGTKRSKTMQLDLFRDEIRESSRYQGDYVEYSFETSKVVLDESTGIGYVDGEHINAHMPYTWAYDEETDKEKRIKCKESIQQILIYKPKQNDMRYTF